MAIGRVAAAVSASTGTAFFVQLATNMAEALGAQVGGVMRMSQPLGQPPRAISLATVIDGVEQPAFDMPMEGAPNMQLLTQRQYVVADHVLQHYPRSYLGGKIGARACAGQQLCNADGEVVGIVGRSGSGKSTLTRLLQRLHSPQRGRILIDGIDIALVDPASLRRQIGVVPQESQLFRGTIRENIALSDPGAPLEKVMQMAHLAGAHGFICDLPEGYDTLVGEHGTGLSGGQKQRIAIARALMRDPRILIFDEATSALDYESERAIQLNMAAICRQRTVLVIAHRLSAVREANRILVLDRGRLVEQGSHDELVARNDGLYARLHRMQQA